MLNRVGDVDMEYEKDNDNLQKLSQKVLFITDLEQIMGRNRLTLRRWWLDGNFPEPVKLNGTTLAWHADSINNWINQNVKVSETKSNI